ncbi:MAG: Unknown protein [uncultured Thiotrichaceae bacterium]|uniref:PASTA domain-containing protein n=1 Tax=uncultured Thiotrichaceae bacterium TaxID=298394 RepID=A0A6S6TFE0_9GAMM|nr:MAG: Unknown protein [uncultured Thiotrichaceae bacterium]
MNSLLTNKLFLLILWLFVFLPQSTLAEIAKPIELPATQSEASEVPAITTNAPIWKNLKTEDLSIPDNKKTDEGFVKPPPNNKLLIRASATTIARGDSITFSLENKEEGVRYFWLIDQQKSTSSEFVVDTSGLSPGKHRVRVTVTDKDKNQKHAAAFFTVEKREFDENERVNENTAESVETSKEDAEKSDPSIETESKAVRIEPVILRVKPGEVATYISSKSAVDGYKHTWTFQDINSSEEQFEIATGVVAPGNYPINLEISSPEGEMSTATASLVVLSETEQEKTMPDFRGITINSLEQQLTENNLRKGIIKTQPSNDKMGIVITHTPAAGERIEEGGVVNFTIGVAADASTPSLLGLTRGGAKEALDKAGFTLGKVTEKPVANQIGLVVEQQPQPGISINKGAAVDISIGVLIREKVVINIKPNAAEVTQGDELRYLFNEAISGEHIVKWKIDEQEGIGPAFNVDTKALKAGKYTVTAEVFLDEDIVANDSEILVINAKDIVMPYLTDLTLEKAQQKLADLGLKVTTIEKREAAISEAKVIYHTPEFGEKITAGTDITLKAVVPRSTPNISLVLSSDKTEVRAGAAITLVSKLEGLEDTSTVHYVYKINNKKKANIRPELIWIPEAEGIYSIVATAYNDTGLIAESSPLGVRVGNAWEAPKAIITPEIITATQGERAEFVSTSTYDVNTTLQYQWNSTTGHSGSKKQFSFYTTDIPAGTYDVTLSVTDGEGNINETTSSLAVMEKASKEATSILSNANNNAASKTAASNRPLFNQEKPVTLKIESSRQFANVGDDVHFNIIANPPGNYSYFISTQDEKDLGWTDSTHHTHKFSDYGTYRVVAALKNGEKVAYSDSIMIWVWSKSLITLIGGIGLGLLLLLMWWTRRSIPNDKPVKKELAVGRTSPIIDPLIDDEEIKNDDELVSEAIKPIEETDIHTEKRTVDKNSVSSVLMRGLIQFILGLGLSVVIIYFILKFIS